MGDKATSQVVPRSQEKSKQGKKVKQTMKKKVRKLKLEGAKENAWRHANSNLVQKTPKAGSKRAIIDNKDEGKKRWRFPAGRKKAVPVIKKK